MCTGNSCRSQMAEALLREAGGDSFEAASAGTTPKPVNEMAIRAMDEAGIDISSQKSKSVEAIADRRFDYVITVCDNARQACPVASFGGSTLHWGIEDPAQAYGTGEERMEVFRRVRDDLRTRILGFVSNG